MGEVRKYAKHKPWTNEEEELLRKLSKTKTESGLAKALNRSVASVKCKRIRMGIPHCMEQTDKIMGVQIAELVGIDKSNIYRTWVDKGFKMQTIGRNKVASEAQLIKFMQEHPELWKASKCDYYFFCRYKWFKERLEREKAGLEKYDYYKDFRFWTAKEISRVKMLKRRGFTHQQIADELGRSKQAINHLSRKLKKEKSESK